MVWRYMHSRIKRQRARWIQLALETFGLNKWYRWRISNSRIIAWTQKEFQEVDTESGTQTATYKAIHPRAGVASIHIIRMGEAASSWRPSSSRENICGRICEWKSSTDYEKVEKGSSVQILCTNNWKGKTSNRKENKVKNKSFQGKWVEIVDTLDSQTS